MPRLVLHDQSGPYRIDPQDKPVFICGCGLSQNLPYCDGAHKGCKDEAPGKVHVYDADRVRIIESRDAEG